MKYTRDAFSNNVYAVTLLILVIAVATMFTVVAHAANTSVTTEIRNGSDAAVTSASVGTVVYDRATVASTTASSTPTGTVDFSLYGNTSCTGTSTTQSGVALVSGIATSATTTVPLTGLSYQAHYNGDASTTPSDGVCESLTATTPPPTPVAHLIVDKVTSPSDDPASFHFTTSGSGYAGFDLADQSTPNDQALAPGAYSVTEATSSAWTLSSSNCVWNSATSSAYTPGATLTLADGDSVVCTFTNTKVGTTTGTSTGIISGEVYNDLNRNEHKDSGEPGLAGWTIKLYNHAGWSGPHNLPPLTSAVTDSNGNYSFSNLPDGIYSVEEINQSGWQQLTSDYRSITLSNGASITDRDFGDAQVKNTVKHRHHFHLFWHGHTYDWDAWW